jgi:hypothetical protein
MDIRYLSMINNMKAILFLLYKIISHHIWPELNGHKTLITSV